MMTEISESPLRKYIYDFPGISDSKRLSLQAQDDLESH